MSTMADTWDDQHSRAAPAASGSTSTIKPKVSKNVVVPDNWELDEEVVSDDWELDEEEEKDTGRPVDLRNKQLWEDANVKVHHPMPLIISRGTSSTSVALPSLPLNQPPPMRILKRPSPSLSSTAPTNPSSATGETLKEREARYHAARERIFGTSPNDEEDKKQFTGKAVSPPFSLNPATSVKLVREPRGPDGSDSDIKGFSERKGMRPPATTISPSTVDLN